MLKVTGRNLPGLIMEYEVGALTTEDIIDLFASLIKSGTVWRLRRTYGQKAKQLIDDGFISKKGEVLKRS